MPLTGRVVEPVRICQISHISNPAAELSSGQNTHNLEETTYISLVGVMRQLCDIAVFADEMFTNLHTIAKDTVERTDKLHNKVKNLNECLLNNTEIDVGDRTGGPGIVAKKQSLFYKGTRPSAIKLKYEESEKTPPLHQFLDLMSVDDIDQGAQPHKLYSDPALFFTAWVDLMEKENREFKKSRKRSFKKTAKEAQVSKIATLKKKVHDPKTKRYVMVDLEPQYATLKGARGATPELPLSATLNRKKYGDPQPMAAAAKTADTTPTNDSYLSPNGPNSENKYRQCSTPIASPPDTEIQIRSPTEIEISVPSMTSSISDQHNTSVNTFIPAPPPAPPAPLPPPAYAPRAHAPPAHAPPAYATPPTPPPASPPAKPLSPTENAPPPFLPPPVPENAIKPDKLTEAQRILRTKNVPEARGRDTLLEMIRSSSFNLKPVQFNQEKQSNAEPTYASWGGRDVASILQRRKYLMGVGDHSDYSSASDSDGEAQWD